MIDFRYHLISIVAVLLALSLGILVGSGFLGEPLLRDIRERAEDVNEANNELRDLAGELREDVRHRDEAIEAAAPLLFADRLAEREVVLFVLEGIQGGVLVAVEDALRGAGANVVTTIRIAAKFEASSPAEQDQLALILRTLPAAPEVLREEAGRALGDRAAEAALLPPRTAQGEPHPVQQRLRSLVDELETAEFIAVEATGEILVPPGALFVILGGGEEEAPFATHGLVRGLAGTIAESDVPVLAAEPADSIWGMVADLRDDPATADSVATVDDAGSVIGAIAVVLALERAEQELIGHYGTGPGAIDILPEPASGS